TVTQDDIDSNATEEPNDIAAGFLDNEASVSATDPQGNELTDEATAEVVIVPLLTAVLDDEGLTPPGIAEGPGDLSASTTPATQTDEALFYFNPFGTGVDISDFVLTSLSIGQYQNIQGLLVGSQYQILDQDGNLLLSILESDDPAFAYMVRLESPILHSTHPDPGANADGVLTGSELLYLSDEQLASTFILLDYTDSAGVIRELKVVVNDDSPEVIADDVYGDVAVDSVTILEGDWQPAIGADQAGSLQDFLSDVNILSIRVGDDSISAASVLVAPENLVRVDNADGTVSFFGQFSYDADPGPATLEQQVDYTITFSDDESGQYSYEVEIGSTTSILISDTEFGTATVAAGSRTGVYRFTALDALTGDSAEGEITSLTVLNSTPVTFWTPYGNYTVPYNTASLLINNSTQGIGVQDQNIESNLSSGSKQPQDVEGVRFNPDDPATSLTIGFKPTGGTGFGTEGGVDLVHVTVYGIMDGLSVNYELVIDSLSGDYINTTDTPDGWIANTSAVANGSLDYAGGALVSYRLEPLLGWDYIEYADVTAGFTKVFKNEKDLVGEWKSSTYKMTVGFEVLKAELLTQDVELEFQVVVTDADGDLAADSFVVSTFDEPMPPVVLDLDRSGDTSYLSVEDGVAFDFGAGTVSTAWLSPEDGLLVYDFNNDGQITEAREFVFTMWGNDPDVVTDMQALAAYFDADSNGVKDRVLDANDTAWSYFGVWQDLNVDGVQDEGEFAYLADWDITGIALSYDADSTTYAAADGDVLVYGQMTVTYADGSTGLAEDVAFAVAPVDASVAETTVPAADAFVQDVAIPDEQVVEAEVASVADLVEQYVGENAVTDEAMAEYQQELALTELPVAADMAADSAAIEPTADALAALDEADAFLPDDASDGIATATDVVDDFSYTV
ncbi:hypothetical protein, partial [Cyanobium sp. A2C-AMD]